MTDPPPMIAADQPLDECEACGADLFLGVPHECPVGGNTVTLEGAP